MPTIDGETGTRPSGTLFSSSSGCAQLSQANLEIIECNKKEHNSFRLFQERRLAILVVDAGVFHMSELPACLFNITKPNSQLPDGSQSVSKPTGH